jgi:hypothetical protein
MIITLITGKKARVGRVLNKLTINGLYYTIDWTRIEGNVITVKLVHPVQDEAGLVPPFIILKFEGNKITGYNNHHGHSDPAWSVELDNNYYSKYDVGDGENIETYILHMEERKCNSTS